MRAITMAVPSLIIRMEVDGVEHEVKGLKSKSPYVKIDGIKYPLDKDERRLARDMMKVFADFGKVTA